MLNNATEWDKLEEESYSFGFVSTKISRIVQILFCNHHHHFRQCKCITCPIATSWDVARRDVLDLHLSSRLTGNEIVNLIHILTIFHFHPISLVHARKPDDLISVVARWWWSNGTWVVCTGWKYENGEPSHYVQRLDSIQMQIMISYRHSWWQKGAQ